MAKMTNAGSRPLYSWWWDSHISPKNSKWLKENLTDMDIKVKTMIKLLEEDADSFARRAEMYYKKRPELLKLVEEFYRAYRALAERYDHATGALRQAQKTMAVAFPNQIPLVLTEESPSGSSITEAALHNSEIPPEIRAMLDSDNSHGAYHGENDAIVTKKGLKQWNGMFDGEEATHAKSAEGRVKKSLNFQDEGINSESKELSQLSKENQNLKIQITSESKRADNIQAEVQSLQETISKLNSEKESVLLKHQLSVERISNMETEISRCQEKFKKHDDQMLMVDSKLKDAEERRLLLDKANQSLQLELDALRRRTKDQQEELNSKQEELEKLNNLIQEKHLQVVQAETARLSLENLQSKSQEEARLLVLEVQSGLQKLKKMELDKVGLEEEIQKLKDENGCLNEQILASAFKIISLQDEIILLKDLKSKLEDEVGLHVEEKKVLQQEISCLKEDRNNLEHRHQQLTEEIKAVNFHVESLWAMVKELQNGNSELKQICKKHEDEKVVHFENLKHLEKISEQNVVLENSLSDANVEVESSREKIKTLEDSYESLNDMMSIHLSQKALLLAQAESDTEEMEKLFERNTVLENSMDDVNVELESLRIKMNALEESCRSLYDQNSSLLSEKGTMIDQVERTIQSLESLEDKYAELESKHLNLEREKDSLLHRIMDLQDSLTREKGEYETLIMSIFLSSKSQLSALENEISLLQENGQLREEEFEVEQHKILDAQIENFILQQCLFDMSEKYSILSVQCQKYLEVSKHAEKSMTEVKEELLVQVKKLTSSTIRIGKLREGIQQMLTELFINREYGSLDDTKDELLLQLTFREIRNLMNFVSDAQDENQLLLLDKSVIITILNQFGLDVINLKAEKFALEQQCEIKNKEFSGLQNAELKLLEMNEQLRHDAEAGNQRHEALNGETEVVRKNLVDLQKSQITLQSEVFKLLEENQSLSEKLSHSRDRADYLEEVNSIILAKVLAMEYLYLIFRSSSAEKASEIQLLRNDLACLNGAKNDIEQEIKLMNETLVAIEAENVLLKETVANLEDCNQRLRIVEDDLGTTRYVIEQLNVEIESGKDLAARKDIELLQANHRFLSIQDKNIELNQNLEDVQLAFDGAMVVREESEGKIFKLSEDNAERENQIVCLRQENGILTTELSKLHLEIESLKTREDHLNFDLRKEADEAKCCEVEIASLLDDIHVTTVTAAVFEEKALELLIACDISAIVQRERLCEEIAIKKSNVNELKKKLASMDGENISLKEETSAYLLLMSALRDDLSHLEEHTLLLANHRASNHPEKQNLTSLEHCKSIQEPSEYLIATMPAGVQELQKLRAKVKELQKAVADAGSLLKREMAESDASIEAAMKEIEVLRSKENFKVKDEQMTKDIQLDLVLSSSQYGIDVGSRRSSTTEEASASDQLLAWETINRGTNKVHYAFEAVEKEKNKYPSSKLVHEKELSIDKLELPNRVKDNHQGFNVEPIEVLSSNALRLSLLQTSVQELKKDLSEMSLEIDKVKPQLKEAEGAIMHLIDTNTKLAKKAEDFTSKSGSLVGKWNEKRNSSRRRISEHAVRGSEKIEKLESELQKIQFMLLKLKEDRESRGAEALERRRVLLKDYLYGKHNSRGKKKSSACGCMKPRTKDD